MTLVEEHVKALAAESIAIQDACNASGVAHAYLAAMRIIHDVSKGTDWVNHHPVLKMYLFKLMDLAGCNCDYTEFSDTYSKVKRIAAGELDVY